MAQLMWDSSAAYATMSGEVPTHPKAHPAPEISHTPHSHNEISISLTHQHVAPHGWKMTGARSADTSGSTSRCRTVSVNSSEITRGNRMGYPTAVTFSEQMFDSSQTLGASVYLSCIQSLKVSASSRHFFIFHQPWPLGAGSPTPGSRLPTSSSRLPPPPPPQWDQPHFHPPLSSSQRIPRFAQSRSLELKNDGDGLITPHCALSSFVCLSVEVLPSCPDAVVTRGDSYSSPVPPLLWECLSNLWGTEMLSW